MADSETTKINLQNDLTTRSGKDIFKFKAGHNVEVPKKMAEDLLRRDFEHQQYKDSLHKKRTFEVNGGTIAAGGGTE